MTDLIEWTNKDAMVIPIIEDKEAVDRIDELMAVPGIDVYDIGPVDLSHSYHLPPDKGFGNPEIAAALEKIVESANKHGKHVMTVPVFGTELTPELAKARLVDKGVRSIFYRTDSVIMRMGTRDALRRDRRVGADRRQAAEHLRQVALAFGGTEEPVGQRRVLLDQFRELGAILRAGGTADPAIDQAVTHGRPGPSCG